MSPSPQVTGSAAPPGSSGLHSIVISADSEPWNLGRGEDPCSQAVGGRGKGKTDVKAETKPQTENHWVRGQREACLLAPLWALGATPREEGGRELPWAPGSCPVPRRPGWACGSEAMPAACAGGGHRARQVRRPSRPRAALRASPERSPGSRHLSLGLLFPVCFSPCYVPGFDFQREFP